LIELLASLKYLQFLELNGVSGDYDPNEITLLF